MSRERTEEALLFGIGIGMLSYLLPVGLGMHLVLSLLIALCLIMLLLLRNFDWRTEGSNPFDWVLVLGVVITLIHLVSFQAFLPGVLSVLMILLFATYYITMSILLWQHRWLFKR